MLKFIIENLLIIFIGLTIITQLIVPSFTNLPYFWFFKSKPSSSTSTIDSKNLNEEVEKKVEEFKEVKTKVDANLKVAQEIKNKTNI